MTPLFSPEEAALLLGWLDKVDTRPVPADLVQRLKKLIGLWAT